jgi:phage baseplate assembly protein W
MSITSQELGKISRSFKDISLNFSRNPVTKDLVILKNEEAIKQSVKNLVLTRLGERLFNPLIGTDTTSYLFELTTTFSANSLIEEIENVLNIYEPRITLNNITVNVEDDSNEFEVIIEYFIIGLPPIVQTVDFILVRES